MRDWERFSWDQEADVQPVPLERAAAARRAPATDDADSSAALAPEHPREDDDGRMARAAEFTEEYMLRPRSLRPSRGWRRAVYQATAGTINLGPSEAELRERELVARVKNPVFGCRRIAVISRKGGVGKTTTTLNLGHTFAAHRGDRVVALDGNPDAGSLGYRVRRETAATVTDLLRDSHIIDRYSDVRAYTSQAPTRLEVVASNDDPRITQALGRDDYKNISEILERHYNLILLDTGTGILDSATRGILDLADQVVVVMAPSLDGARAASLTLDWLEEHDYGDLVEGAVAVVNGVRGRDGLVELDRVEEHFESRCATVVRIPWDPHLDAGAETMPEDLKRGTREAYLQLAAAVAEGFGPD